MATRLPKVRQAWRDLQVPVRLVTPAWAWEIADHLFLGGVTLGIGPDSPWWTAFTFPISHEDFTHLAANTAAFVPASWLVLLRGRRVYATVLVAAWVANIACAWGLPLPGFHGASGLVYGLLGYLFLIGWVERRFATMALSLVALFLFGPALSGVVPGLAGANISWSGHLSGLLGGLAVARWFPRGARAA